jgi:hypothetical protein
MARKKQRIPLGGPSTPGMNPMAGRMPMPASPPASGLGAAPMTGLPGRSLMKTRGRPLSAFMPSPKKAKRGKKGQKRLAV